MPLLLLLLLLVACTASEPGRYRDGARLPPPEPRTTYTPAGAGLPEYFAQPEQRRPPEPVPTRALPETPESRKEPGLWGAESPQAAKGTPTAPEILGVPLPGLPTDTGEPDHAASRV